eukprot:TRINITY_DN9840_c0_g1_i1.p1 TRINITY_DN9840_c0_g1~~TRINITY_DN9840_c0_g1_i1.p1  ORF type:complete len:262 (-),score=35.24 TRINITY_DN9840_c0_g1_i1:139-924(-)
MSKLTLRSKKINPRKPMPIIRGELPDEEISVCRAVPSMPTGMAPQEEEEAHIHNAIVAKKNVAQIPTPKVRPVVNYESEANLLPPFQLRSESSYIQYTDEGKNNIEYDIESDDEDWLKEVNAKSEVISEDDFEYLMDLFEKHKARYKDLHFTQEEALKLVTQKNLKAVTGMVFEHWKNKFKKHGRLILSRYILDPPTLPHETNSNNSHHNTHHNSHHNSHNNSHHGNHHNSHSNPEKKHKITRTSFNHNALSLAMIRSTSF